VIAEIKREMADWDPLFVGNNRIMRDIIKGGNPFSVCTVLVSHKVRKETFKNIHQNRSSVKLLEIGTL